LRFKPDKSNGGFPQGRMSEKKPRPPYIAGDAPVIILFKSDRNKFRMDEILDRIYFIPFLLCDAHAFQHRNLVNGFSGG